MVRGRKPSVRYWDSVGGYCCWIKGERHILAKGEDDAPTGKTYLEAHAKFKKLIELDANIGTNDYLVSALLNQYRTHLNATRKSQAPGIFETLARGFSQEFGAKRVAELKPYEFEAWLNRQDQWNATSKAHAGGLILGAVSWAARKNLIEKDPLKGKVDLPTPVLKGREARFSQELIDLLIAESCMNQHKSKEFGDFLWALRECGARPIELRMAEAKHFHKSNGMGKIIYPWNTVDGYQWKNSAKTQRDRVIYLTKALCEHVEKLVAKYPTGKLFRTPRGAMWSLTSICNKWRWLVKRPKVVAYCDKHGLDPDKLKPYSMRHSFISDYLDKTGDYYGCAQMCGTSIRMLELRYSHPDINQIHQRLLDYVGK